MSVVAPQGFRAAGVAAGLKSTGGLDLALVVNDGPAACGRRRVHSQQGQGGAGAVDAAGARHRPPAGRRPQLRRCERVHGAGRFPDRARHRREGRRGPRLRPDRGRGLFHRIDRQAAPARGRARRSGGRRSRTRRGRRLRAGRRHRDHDDGHRREAGRAHRRGRMEHRRHHQGRGDDRSLDGHHAHRAHHGCRGRLRGPGRGPAPRRPGQLRPAGRRRLYVHQRHRARARLRRLGRRPGSARVHRRADGRLSGPRAADAGRRGGRHQADHRAGHRCRHRGRGRDGRPHDRPRQPGEDRDLRVGRQLGPDRGGRGIRRRCRRAGPPRHHR